MIIKPETEDGQRLKCRRCWCEHFIMIHEETLSNGQVKSIKVCRHCLTRMCMIVDDKSKERTGLIGIKPGSIR